MFCTFSYWIAQKQDLHLQFLQVLRRLGQNNDILLNDCSQAQDSYTWRFDAVFISEIDGFCESWSKQNLMHIPSLQHPNITTLQGRSTASSRGKKKKG